MSTRKRFNPRSALPGSPFLTHVTLREDRVQAGVHPFTVPWLVPSLDLQLSAPVTFLVGENGTGKSTLLEAIAWSVGFGAQGGNRDQSFAENADGYALGRALRLSWRQNFGFGFNESTRLESRYLEKLRADVAWQERTPRLGETN
jgi:predicted ATPase